ncbi:pyridoxine/pyridoxamine 5'-phosphate oxidase isoform X2 [Bacillus rossius redtenbacheri]|uniref:pyridoxine/pyridoxamine 5'-phosphate oxidase isoform X2 n=1 Tax=Bacillus rossius redtenbacheri TaxID=93214 RepID=UPI002FDDA6E6
MSTFFIEQEIILEDSKDAGMRKKYKDDLEVFTEDDLKLKEPIGQFRVWFEEACKRPEILEPNEVHLATATKDGAPSVRPVLLKGFGTDGFRFFSNYNSRKGRELAENPRAALSFYWPCLNRCVRVEGRVEKIPASESDEYFHSRPIGSQIGSAVSEQSKPIAGRQVLIEKEKAMLAEYGTKNEVPRPSWWGGYIVVPEAVEFWQGQTTRLHDRIRFRKPRAGEEVPDGRLLHQGDDGWVYERLSP